MSSVERTGRVAPREVSLVIRNAAELATPLGNSPRLGAALGQIQLVPEPLVAIDGEQIVAIGPQ
jgi:hypothetical protein